MRNKINLPLLLLIFVLGSCEAKDNKKSYTVAFYNVENLFDTVDDPATNDDEFTPKGAYRYTEKVYKQKIHNIATVIGKLDAAIIGLAEVENSTVLNELIQQPELQKRHYKYAWFNSQDPRGIDVALLYDTDIFSLVRSYTIPVKMKGLHTRDVLYVCGVLQDDTIHILVNHWPSRREGVRESEPKRIAVAKVNKKVVDSLLGRNSQSNIIIMGDMNDNPDNNSIAQVLGASSKGKLNNPWLSGFQSGKGTSVYQKQWDHFDQIIISRSLSGNKGLHMESAKIFDADFIRNTKFEDAYPLRSFKGYNWVNGYSDHLPIYIRLIK
ncbi:MAG: endonuclease/exonuclease/phosphatase [Chitinophagaceae bacterium]|nr:endonuclease/exonuclease/phosphatase [Chitinophagaceae bacterium]MCB9047346.1 endonuclease [Chitinophagales bacterium]